MDIGLHALERTFWLAGPKPIIESASFVPQPSQGDIFLPRANKSDVLASNANLQPWPDGPVSLVIATDGSHHPEIGYSWGGFAIMSNEGTSILHTVFEGIGGSSYVAEQLALIRAFSTLFEDSLLASTDLDRRSRHYIDNEMENIVAVSDFLPALTMVKGLLEDSKTGHIANLDLEIATLLSKTMSKLNVNIYLTHAHSHNGMWANELVNDIINRAASGTKTMGWAPAAPNRLGRRSHQTKSETKALLYKDEDLFWFVLTKYNGSISGHVKHTLNCSRPIIIVAHKLLAFDKAAQTAFNRLLTADLFKRMGKGQICYPLFPVCNELRLQWIHFARCFNLGEAPLGTLRKPETLSELAKCVSSFQ